MAVDMFIKIRVALDESGHERRTQRPFAEETAEEVRDHGGERERRHLHSGSEDPGTEHVPCEAQEA